MLRILNLDEALEEIVDVEEQIEKEEAKVQVVVTVVNDLQHDGSLDDSTGFPVIGIDRSMQHLT